MKALLTALVFMVLSSSFALHGASPTDNPDGYVVVLLGPPGSGKGTQAVDLSKKLNVPHISVGDLFRYHKKNNTELGRKAVAYMDKGLLVPDSLTIEVLAARVAEPDCKVGYILDGFPRTIPQAIELGNTIIGNKRLVVVNLDIADAEIIKRLSGRLMCRQCGNIAHKDFSPPKQDGICDLCGGELYQRDDDKPDVIKQRLSVYHDQTEPLIDYYSKLGVLLEFDGSKPKQQVFSEISNSLDSIGIVPVQ